MHVVSAPATLSVHPRDSMDSEVLHTNKLLGRLSEGSSCWQQACVMAYAWADVTVCRKLIFQSLLRYDACHE